MFSVALAACLTFVPADTASRSGFLLAFTLPSEGDSVCSATGAPDRFTGVWCYDDSDTTRPLSVLTFTGFECGLPSTGDTVRWWVEVAGQRRVFVLTVDDAGNVACGRSNAVDVDGGPQPIVGVVTTIPHERVDVFDLHGRRVTRSAIMRPGLYFVRRIIGPTKRVQRIVVLEPFPAATFLQRISTR